jgi:hypothetical protein
MSSISSRCPFLPRHWHCCFVYRRSCRMYTLRSLQQDILGHLRIESVHLFSQPRSCFCRNIPFWLQLFQSELRFVVQGQGGEGKVRVERIWKLFGLLAEPAHRGLSGKQKLSVSRSVDHIRLSEDLLLEPAQPVLRTRQRDLQTMRPHTRRNSRRPPIFPVVLGNLLIVAE